MTEQFKKFKEQGKIAEVLAEDFCIKNNLIYSYLVDDKEFQDLGIDLMCVEDGEIKHIDVKNTPSIYLGNVRPSKDGAKFFRARNPFKKTSKAKYYWILDPITKTWFYRGLITEYLLEHFFYSENAWLLFKNKIQSIDNKKFAEEDNMIGASLRDLKNQLIGCLKKDVHLDYEKFQDSNSWTFRMYTKKMQDYFFDKKGIIL